jgi:NitT/TauT family transport system substrate-binding protein
MRGMRRVGVLLTVGALLLTACGDDESDDGPAQNSKDGGAGGGLTKVTVAETAGIPAAFLDYGVQKGLFEEQGLDVEVRPGQGGAAEVPAVVAGDVEFAGSNAVSILLAAEKGLPLKIVAPGTFTGEQYSSVMVPKDGDISEPRDLEGKTFGINTLDNIAEVTSRAALEKEGLDTSSLEFTEIQFPDMVNAVESGRIDAGFMIPPFSTLAEDSGLKAIAHPFWGTKANLQIGLYVATDKYVMENPDTVEAFAAGVAATAQAIDDDVKAFRSALTELTELTPELAERTGLPHWGAENDVESLKLIAELMVKYGISEEEPDVESLIHAPGS